MNMIKGALQSELDAFFNLLNQDGSVQVTKAAYCKARQKFEFTAFQALNHEVINLVYSHSPTPRWHGLRVCAVDGSTLKLPDVPALAEEFGLHDKNQKRRSVLVKLSKCVDVHTKLTLSATVGRYDKHEMELASHHLKSSQADDVFVYDRGYPGFWFFKLHEMQNRYFCIRAPQTFSKEIKAFVASGAEDALIDWQVRGKHSQRLCHAHDLPSTPMRIRLIHVRLPHGETEVLVTNLLDQARFPCQDFSALYRSRWTIEEHFKQDKLKMELENFSSYTVRGVLQDIHAKLLSENIAMLLAGEAQVLVKQKAAARKRPYQINHSYTINHMKDNIVRLLIADNPDVLWAHMVRTCARVTEPVRPGRKFPHDKSRHARKQFHGNCKRCA